MSTHTLLMRSVIFVTLTVFIFTSHCSVFAYANVNTPSIDPDDFSLQKLVQDVPLLCDPEATAFLTDSGIKIYGSEDMPITTVKSSAMKIYHGADMAYNPDTKQLVVTYGQPYYKKIAVLNPKTLKIVKIKTLNLPAQLPGMPESYKKAYAGITALTYNTKYKQYVARTKGMGYLLVFDQNFKPVRYVHLSKRGGQIYQSMDTVGDYILVGQSFSPGKPYNKITVYDWTGAYVSTIRVRKGYELENVFHANGVFYSGFYTSGYKTVYVKKYKTKIVNGKKKRVKVKVKQRQLYRSNYIYKVTNL